MLATITVNHLGDFTDSNPNVTTLREAIAEANIDGNADLILFDSNLDGQTITLTQGQLSISESVTIDGRDSSGNSLNITIDAGGGTNGVVGDGDGHSVFVFLGVPSNQYEINSLTLTGGDSASGGAILAYGGNLTIKNSVITANASLTQGGGIDFQGAGQLILHDVVLADNIAGYGGYDGKGGGLYVEQSGNDALVEIRNSQIIGNEVRDGSANHGGLYIYQLNSDASVGIYDTIINNNKALGRESNFAAGTIFSDGTITIERSTISGNFAQDDLGGIAIYSGGNVSIKDTTISDNQADFDGSSSAPLIDGPAGLLLGTRGGAQFTIEGTTISGNIGNNAWQDTGDPNNGAGGGVYIYNTLGGIGSRSVRFLNTTISGNQSDGVGGGVAIVNTRETQLNVSFESSTIVENRADMDGDGLSLSGNAVGGGIFVGDSAYITVTLKNTVVAGNFLGTGTTRSDIAGTVTANWSLIGDNTGATISGANNLEGTSTTPIDPGLAPLAGNGGPTLTHRPLANSPVIDAGNPSLQAGVGDTPLYDQRGIPFSRVVDGDGNSVARIDIGAVEFDTALPPKVINVTINSWSAATPHAPHSFNDPNNEASDFDGSGVQLKTVPVGNADTISIQFSEDVNVVASDLKLHGLVFATQPLLASSNPFSYDNNTFLATWRFAAPFLADQYLIWLGDSVTNTAAGTPLDGEWVNPASVASTNSSGLISVFPSGNDIAGGDFKFVFTILPGDLDLSNSVRGRDFLYWQQYAGGPGRTFTQGDYNGDGYTDSLDLAFYQLNYGLDLSLLRIAADFDEDGDVDAMDLALWQANHGTGTTHGEGDADWDGDVDGRDFLIWQRQFGIIIDVAI